MRNALISGLIIGTMSAIWIMIMHLSGFNPENIDHGNQGWIEYTSILIPFLGLYFGIKGFRKENGGKLNFFEGVFEGFKIMLIGGFLAAIFSFAYINIFAKELTINYMERIFGAIIIGLLFTLVNALLLMTTPKQL